MLGKLNKKNMNYNSRNANFIVDNVLVKILKLQNGMKVQESSVSLMTFIVQDLLDFA